MIYNLKKETSAQTSAQTSPRPSPKEREGKTINGVSLMILSLGVRG